MELLRLAVAARRVGVHPGTLRLWANEGKVAVVWVGRERRFSTEALDALTGSAASSERREALYVRVSGTSGQESSLAVQEAELRASASGVVVAVFRDRASGLRESRPGLDRLLRRAAAGEFTHVRVSHRDRLARFGAAWLIEVLAHRGVAVEVLHAKGTAGGMEELLDDFMSLVATFAGRRYGLRSREARRRLLAEADERIGDPASGTGAGRFIAPEAEAEAEAVRASVIYLEDLATLEARGRRRGNARLSGQVRGTITEAMRHLAAKQHIAVVTVPARGTSKLCPQCLGILGHHPASDRTGERGWKWAHCTGCGLSLDRDHAAARRIVSRGLLAQPHTTTDRATHARTIHTPIEGTVTVVRRPKKTTHRLRRAHRTHPAPERPPGPKTTPGKHRPTPSRPAPGPPGPHHHPAQGPSPVTHFPPYARRAYGPRHHPHRGGQASGGA